VLTEHKLLVITTRLFVTKSITFQIQFLYYSSNYKHPKTPTLRFRQFSKSKEYYFCVNIWQQDGFTVRSC